MSKAIGYIRVSTAKQDHQNQELEIRRYAEAHGIAIDEWFKLQASSRKSASERRIDELLSVLEKDDTLIVSELSRLGRSLGQVVTLVDALKKKGVTLIGIKDGLHLNGEDDVASKVQVGLFALMAEIERDLISERTKLGLQAAKARGKQLGRPKGSKGRSKLDGREEEIVDLLGKGMSKRALSRYLGVAAPTLKNFIDSRNLSV